MRASLQYCDMNFSWKMYGVVYRCITKLNLHNLDQHIPNYLAGQDASTSRPDHDRKSLWSLVLDDLFFRLLHDKPAIMTANTSQWRVNLPQIDVTEDTEQVVTNISFIAKSRLTFLLLDFFDFFHEVGAEDTLIQRTTDLCAKINALLKEWSIVSLQ